MATYSAGAVANYFLDRAAQEDRTLTHLKLQKLVYIAHGWHLAVTGRPLLKDPIQAWKYGPVIPTLYQELKRYGNQPVTDHARWWDSETRTYHTDSPEFEAETNEVLDKVWSVYKKFSAAQLSTLTHQEGTPWFTVTDGGRIDSATGLSIGDDSIQEHYVSLAGVN